MAKNNLLYGTSYVTKVIKNTNSGSYAYNSNGSYTGWNSGINYYVMAHFNNTSYGSNHIYNTMNSTIYNALGSSITNNIATTRFYFKYNNTSNSIYDFSTTDIYNYERNGSCIYGNCFIDTNIALLNLSDYLYASQAVNCARSNSCAGNVTQYQNNWIGKMTYNNISTNGTWLINYRGYNNSSKWINQAINCIGNSSYLSIYCNTSAYNYSSYYIFPVFYLKNQGYASKGAGTSSNPYYFSI